MNIINNIGTNLYYNTNKILLYYAVYSMLCFSLQVLYFYAKKISLISANT